MPQTAPTGPTPWSANFAGKIGLRLAASFAAISLLMIVLGLQDGWQLYQHDRQFGEVLDKSIPELTALQNVGSEVAAISMAARDACLASTQEASHAALARIDQGRASIGDQIQRLQTTLTRHGDEGRKLAEQLTAHSSGILVTLVKFSRLHKAGRTEQAKALFGQDLQGKMQALSDTIQRAEDLELRLLAEQKSQSARRLRSSLEISGALLCFAVSMSVLLAWRLTRSIVQPINEAVEVARRVAQGDLRTHINTTRTDEIGLLLKSMSVMQVKLSELVHGILDTVRRIEQTSAEIGQGNEDLSARTDRAAGSLRSTSAAVDEMARTFESSANSARSANQLVHGTSEGVSRSGKVVAQVIYSMEDISTSSAKISDIVGVIDSIAFQTNILALNAAVEAARAGEQGRGFAVVASEVRALAQRSANSAREIKSLIQASVEKVQTGSALVGEAGSTMNALIAQVQEVSALINAISDISVEQSQGVVRVNASVNELNEATQRNAALVEHTSQAAATLRSETAKLAQAVGVFQLT
jgi:methyl-accepting chemotaxis protein